jgi:putative transposase
MSRPLRLEFEGGVYHIVARGNERRDIFRDDRDRERYLERLSHYRDRFGFQLLAFCLMSNHVHLVVETGKMPLSRVMLGLQGSYTQWFNRRHRRSGHLFQGRYKAFLVQEDEYLQALVRYVHENPVKAKIVERARLYPWSSDRFYRKGRGPGWLDLERVLETFGKSRRRAAAAYVRFMEGEPELSYEDLKAFGQVVKGDERFAEARFRQAAEPAVRRLGVSIDKVARIVARELGVELSVMKGPSRAREVSKGRGVTAYVAREAGRIALSRTADYFGRDGSTLVRNVALLESELPDSPALRKQLSSISSQLA